jgi:uncharacterized membrane protein YqaE (UPF0057 family)
MSFGYIILCIIVPPLAVYLKTGESKDTLINLVLTIAGLWLIGVIHALVMVSRASKEEVEKSIEAPAEVPKEEGSV